MLAKTTLRIMQSGLEADPSLGPRDRARIMAYLRDCGEPPKAQVPAESVARIVRRAEVANRLSCSLRTVDKLAASGILQKRKLPGRKRASGFLEADLIALVTAENPQKGVV
jgi:hypothetical protein